MSEKKKKHHGLQHRWLVNTFGVIFALGLQKLLRGGDTLIAQGLVSGGHGLLCGVLLFQYAGRPAQQSQILL